MNILLLGSGGREHALAWKIAQSKHTGHLYISPGNAGTMHCGENVPLNLMDFKAIGNFVLDHHIDMLVVGPEEPLVKGISDFFLKHPSLKDVPVIGPSAAGAQLEGSKDFSKAFMLRNGIPTARYESFTPISLPEAKTFLKTLKPPYVLKASGLAAGKGVVIPPTLKEAEAELEAMLGGKFGEAGNVVVIEEFLEGIECSVFVLTDGNHFMLLPEAKDYKRIGEDDTGPNTGGMGAVSPVPFCTAEFLTKVETRIIKPTLEGLQNEGISYKGFIFFGIMNVGGDPFLIEYNCRMGDPETEVVIPRLENDLVELFNAVSGGTLDRHILQADPRTAVTVMCVSAGYPSEYRQGIEISGLEKLDKELVFHAGTTTDDEKVITSGGRVIAFTTLADSLPDALAGSYAAISNIHYEGIYFRKDIGQDLL